MKNQLILTLTALSMLAACSSSSDKDSGSPPVVDMSITSANAMSITWVSYEAALSSTSIGTLAADTNFIASGPNDVSKLGYSISQSIGSSGATAGVPFPAVESACAGGGSTTISGDIADIVTFNLSPADFFDVAFDMCNDGAGTTIDGAVGYVVDAFSGNFLGGIYDLTMTMTVDTLQASTVDDVVTMSGDATTRLDTLLTPAIAAEVSGRTLTVDTNSSSESLSDFSSAQTVDAGMPQSPYTMSAAGTLDSSQIDGVVQYSTPTTFEGFGVDYPHTGVFLVSGGDSSARLTALDNVNVRIEIDSNGDSSIDETINTTWAELEGT
jgi:hypothetical protein